MAQILMNAPLIDLIPNRPLPPLSRLAFGLAHAVLTWETRRQGRLALARLEPHLLRDVGITVQEASIEAEKPFWRA
ncbi:MAG TPA: DUF1127 domain-containing protein [Paracoccaceae bacterium]